MQKEKILNFLNNQKLIFVIILITIILAFWDLHFISFFNIRNIFMFISIEGLMVIGIAYLLILKELDLSIGSNMALAAAFAVRFQEYGVIFGILAGMLVGLLIGFLNGLLVTKLKLSSIAVTLGMMIMLSGFVFAITGGQTIIGKNPNFPLLATLNILNIPLPIIIFIIAIIIFEIILQKTVYGKNIFAVGGNQTASRFFGIKDNLIKISVFTITGFLAGTAGVLLAARLNIASGRLGLTTVILVITAALLGGVSLAGGEGSVVKAFQGILLIGILNNAMVILQINLFVQDIIRGLLLIVVLIVGSIYARRNEFI